MRNALPLILMLLATACHREEKPEAPTPAEATQLNEAEEMLDNLAANEEGAAPEGTAPDSSDISSSGVGGK